ncbi:MAG: hypothetical protein QOK28_808 [Actinomycetota bacterium]
MTNGFVGYSTTMFRPRRLEMCGELFRSRRYPDVKDPSVAFDGTTWHVFGTGCGLPGGLEIFHWTAPTLDGPWAEQRPAELVGVDVIANAAAPGVICDGATIHMFLHHDFNILGGHIEHLVSEDHGLTFVHEGTALESVAGSCEAGVYDPDPALIDGWPYLTYAAMSKIGQPDLFLARSASGSWDGPWERCGRVLGHHEVEYHNQLDDEDYEWGLEGPQLLELPDGRVLLTAVCFLAEHPRGSRQRVLLAVADDPAGPYGLLGPILEPSVRGGENGHGTSVVEDGAVRVIYQERAGDGRRWHVRSAITQLEAASATLRKAG